MSREYVCSTLDGNAAGGLLREVFVFDATAARITCAGCAKMVPMGELRLYAVELGAILRCPSCDVAVVRIARTPQGLWLDLLGAATVIAVSDGDVHDPRGRSEIRSHKSDAPRRRSMSAPRTV